MILADILELWNSTWPAGIITLGLGSAFAIILLIASEKLKVKVDPQVSRIRQALPNIDCGACGFAGCSQYAKAVSKNPQLLGKCAPGGEKVSANIAAVLNLEISKSGPGRRPIVRCRAHTDDKIYNAIYQGIQTCTSANALSNAQACIFGCLGFGDCVKACKFDALHIIDGLAIVNYDKCTGCGACAKACPRNLILMAPFFQPNIMLVACSSKENGKTTRTMCKVGCIGCGICAKQSDMFKIQDNLAGVDYESYEHTEQSKTAMSKCPTKVIIYVGKNVPTFDQISETKTS